ncbi:MAG: hypothetical protein EHM35_05995 [Planctomycetaceae bacterium]|nr:MAG: hypothetical protein EHM35_05995 [Planctomycetaceae bacterium]
MVAVTATWEIPYAQSIDPFCDGPEITQALAERVDALLDTQDAALGLLQRPQYASISVTTPAPTESFRIRYDTTDEDTANLVDLALDPFSIYPDSVGLWLNGIHAATSTLGLGTNETWEAVATFSANTIYAGQTIREELNVRSVGAFSAGQIFDTTDSYRMDSNLVGSGGLLVSDVYKARFWAWRYSDLP